MQKKDTRYFRLQLFADGGDGGGEGGGSGAGVTPEAAAPESRLEALGVPRDKIRKRAKGDTRQQKAPEPAPIQDAAEQKAESVPRMEGQEENAQPKPEGTEEAVTEEQTHRRMSWDEVMADPEYNKAMQETIQKRLKESKAAQETLDKLGPALEVLAGVYHVDAGDAEALTKAVTEDSRYYEEKALEMGVSPEIARRIDQAERQEARRREQEAQSLEQQKIRQHLTALQQQGEALRKTFPQFDLNRELQNPVFRRLTAPGSGLSVEDAYYAVHRAEIQAAATQVVAQKTAQKLAASIQSGQRRPMENGTQSQAPSVSTMNYRTMSREQREAFKRSIREAAARGEKVYPGTR